MAVVETKIDPKNVKVTLHYANGSVFGPLDTAPLDELFSLPGFIALFNGTPHFYSLTGVDRIVFSSDDE